MRKNPSNLLRRGKVGMNKQRSRAGQADTLPNVKPKERIMANPSKNQTEQVQAAVASGKGAEDMAGLARFLREQSSG